MRMVLYDCVHWLCDSLEFEEIQNSYHIYHNGVISHGHSFHETYVEPCLRMTCRTVHIESTSFLYDPLLNAGSRIASC
jgi:hypothetical protein